MSTDPRIGHTEERLSHLVTTLAERYRIDRELGAGGMATVYVAEDVRHHRKVAVKVLHPELSAVLGPERFLKEIELTAGLQHPHILPLFDSGSADGQLYYVMPFVEGETLRARLERERQLPVRDALRIAREVADALAYAHAHHVIHRDVKPENILLQGGHALVADFGIALAVQQAGGQRITQTGLSLGTPQYMAPEQAAGEKSVDARADVYALGAVTYEMLAGEPPFSGPTTQAVIAKVLTAEPTPLVELRRTVPRAVSAAVHTALAKLPADRFASATELAAALTVPDHVELASSAHDATDGQRAPRVGPRPRPLTTYALAALGALAIAAASFWLGGRMLAAPAAPLTFGRATHLTWDPGIEVQPAISPDGRAVAYVAGTSVNARIHVRQLAGGRAIRLADDSTLAEESPSWSPDGARVLYLARGAVFSAPAAGGAARQEVPAHAGARITAAAWSPDGSRILYSAGDSLFVRDADGASRPLAPVAEPTLCRWSPDAAFVACASGNARYHLLGIQFGNLSPNRVVVVRVRDGAATTVSDSVSVNVSPQWSRDGRTLYYVSNREGTGDVYAQEIDRDGRATGAPMRLTTGLGANTISLSADGTRLAYGVYTHTANVWSMPIPTGAPVGTSSAIALTAGVQVVENVSVSFDGRWLVYDSNVAGNSDIYRISLSTPNAPPERLTSDPVDEFSGSLSPDGTELAFHSWRSGSRDVWVQPLDGRPLQRVTSTPRQEWNAEWSPDGRAIVLAVGVDSQSILIARRGGDGAWTVRQRATNGVWPVFSPDGRWIAYCSVRCGTLYVMPSDSGSPRPVLDASRPGTPKVERPRWSADGRTIYFKSHDERGAASFWSVPVAGGVPRLLVRLDDPARPSYRPQWTVGRDRFYFMIDDRQSDVWVMNATPRDR